MEQLKIESMEYAYRSAKELGEKMIHVEGNIGWISFWMRHFGMPHYQPPVPTAPGSSTDVGELQ